MAAATLLSPNSEPSFIPQEEHPYYEVETTIVPGEECGIQERAEDDISTSAATAESTDRKNRTKICTKYIPHRPSRYLGWPSVHIMYTCQMCVSSLFRPSAMSYGSSRVDLT